MQAADAIQQQTQAGSIMDNSIRYSVITGASQGYGRAMAFQLASRKFNLIIASLPGEGLPELSEKLKTYGIDVRYYEVDLTKREELRHFSDWVNAEFNIHMLINNAGVGGTRHFLEASDAYLERIIDLNMTATVMLTHRLLPNLLRQDVTSRILNVSSMAAFSPMAYKTIYPASKRFVRDFSLGLSAEYRDSNLKVSVVHPGAMKTNENVSKRISNHGFASKLGVLPPEKAAEITIRKFLNGQSTILLGIADKIQRALLYVLPEKLSIRILSAFFKKQTAFN